MIRRGTALALAACALAGTPSERDVVQIVILREGARQTVTATLGTRGG
jgi:hypothetical protein